MINYINQYQKENIVFIDIETSRLEKELTVETLDSWQYASKGDSDNLSETYNKEAGLKPEFSRVVCITIGMIKNDKIVLRSYNDSCEKKLLTNFNKGLTALLDNNGNLSICGHYIKLFDIPFLVKRFTINGIKYSNVLDLSILKPWEADFIIDTYDKWKAPLSSICFALGLTSPKSFMSGEDVGDYFHSGRIDEITKYCEGDVTSLINCFLKMGYNETLSVGTVKEKEEKLPLIKRLFNGAVPTQRDLDMLRGFAIVTAFDNIPVYRNILNAIVTNTKKSKSGLTKAMVKSITSISAKEKFSDYTSFTLPKKDEKGYYVSESQVNTFNKTRTHRDYIRSYFFGDKFTGNKYTDFGSLVGESLENNDFSKFTEKEQQYLRGITRYDEFEKKVYVDRGWYNIVGYIDSNTKDLTKLLDYKTGDIEERSEYYMSDEYRQLHVYSEGLRQETGKLPEDARVVLIHREEDSKSKKLKLGLRTKELVRTIDEKSVNKVLEHFDRTAREISIYTSVFNRLLTLK